METAPGRFEIARMVETTEIAAYADVVRVAPRRLEMQAIESDGALCLLAPAVDLVIFNRVLGLGLTAPATRTRIEPLVDRYRSEGVKNFAIQLSPEAGPEELPAWLELERLQVRDAWTKFYRPLERPQWARSDLRVEWINRPLAATFADVACAGFGLPASLSAIFDGPIGLSGWRHYLAYEGDTPVAAAALFVRGFTGWLGMAATLPAYRGRGAQGVLTARRILDAAKMGCRYVVAETAQELPEKPNPSYHNMVRAGFQVAYHRPNYMPNV